MATGAVANEEIVPDELPNCDFCAFDGDSADYFDTALQATKATNGFSARSEGARR